jgi:pyridoxamine 5'-phosphate oxidase
MPNRDLNDIRRDYDSSGLNEASMMQDPLDQFDYWLDEVLETDILDPLAATLATATPNGVPSARIILVKEVDEEGFIFYTNYGSKKGFDTAQNPTVCLNFYWDVLHRQVRITGTIKKIETDKSEAYFASRPRESQIMATVSPQSSAVPNRAHLDNAYLDTEAALEGRSIPLPENWGGYKVTPYEMEFWQGRPSRLHDRVLYTHKEGQWTKTRLAP